MKQVTLTTNEWGCVIVEYDGGLNVYESSTSQPRIVNRYLRPADALHHFNILKDLLYD